MREASHGAAASMKAVMTAAIKTKSAEAVPITSPPRFPSPRPICCPSIIVVPIENDTMMLVSVIISCEPVETPESAADDENLPTIIRSTAPYMACRKFANITGRANFKSGRIIGPLVKSVVFLISILYVFFSVMSSGSHRFSRRSSAIRFSRF